MLAPRSVLELLTARDVARLEQSASDPVSSAAREIDTVLERARRNGATDEHVALALGLVLSLAEFSGKSPA